MRRMRSRLLGGVKFCAKCGARVLLQGYDTQNRYAHLMDKEKICYECAYWTHLKEYPPKLLEVIENKCYKVTPGFFKKSRTIRLGGKGKRRWFMRKDWSVVESNDIWLVGEIPLRFRAIFPVTLVEITQKAYKQLTRNSKKCLSRACYNRYKCFRYDISLENDEIGAFNVPPKDWNPKDERCGFYLPKEEILGDYSSFQTNQTT